MPASYARKRAQFKPGTTTPHERLFAGREPEFSAQNDSERWAFAIQPRSSRCVVQTALTAPRVEPPKRRTPRAGESFGVRRLEPLCVVAGSRSVLGGPDSGRASLTGRRFYSGSEGCASGLSNPPAPRRCPPIRSIISRREGVSVGTMLFTASAAPARPAEVNSAGRSARLSSWRRRGRRCSRRSSARPWR
jgi:hypothetical protein